MHGSMNIKFKKRNRQSVPKRRHIKFRHPGNYQEESTQHSEQAKILNLETTTRFPFKNARDIFFSARGITILQKGESWIKERLGRDFGAGT